MKDSQEPWWLGLALAFCLVVGAAVGLWAGLSLGEVKRRDTACPCRTDADIACEKFHQ